MIKKLNWDSDFFGYLIAKFKTNSKEEFEKVKLQGNLDEYKLIYIYSNEKIDKLDSLLVDRRTSFIKQIKASNTTFKTLESIVEYDSAIHSYKQLLDLSYLSGTYSRFNIDPKFKSNEYLKLYKSWLDKSINEENIKVLIKIIDNVIAGFITLEEEISFFNIGLLAVNSKFKGKGIGSSLINYCVNIARNKNKNKIKVVTQGDNISAVKFYKKNDFEIEDIKYIYHYWNL